MIRDSLEATLQRQFKSPRSIDSPADLLKEAVDNCIRQGATEQVTAAQLTLELRRLTEEDLIYLEQAVWRRPEWIGQQLRMMGIRDQGLKVGRAPLRHHHTHLRPPSRICQSGGKRYVGGRGDLPPRRRPFDFCERNMCSTCPYERICATTIEGLQQAKSLNRGKSGRHAAVTV